MAFYGYGWPRYVSVAEKRARAERKLKQLQKKNPGIRPITLEGNTLARTWWGKAWNRNLERYADYANRIGRGRSYVRHRAVLDLQIEKGKVRALVMGSGRDPYKIDVTIKPISKARWTELKKAAAHKLGSLQELLAGRFPDSLAEIFTTPEKGLFPTPKEIAFDCSCPDWADMCKHVAAVLYGIGARLDEDPGLLFTLRKVNVQDLITETVKDQSKKLLKDSKRTSKRVMTDGDLGEVFGIDLETAASLPRQRSKPQRTTKTKKKAKKKVKKKVAKKKGAKRPVHKVTPKKSRPKSAKTRLSKI